MGTPTSVSGMRQLYEGSHLTVKIRIPWDRLVARGFLLSLLLHMALFFLALHLRWYPEAPPQRTPQVIPVELLTLGWGEGDKPAGGNLSPEGRAYRQRNSPKSALEDASRAQQPARATNQAITEPSTAIPRPASATPAKALSSEVASKTSALQAQGLPDALSDGSGLGVRGEGAGRGLGFDIEWGGGGNRIVLHKVLPQYPRGYNVVGRVRLRFTVLPDGTVGNIVPVQRSDPVLERAAIEALRRWRFNPLSTPTEMLGIITFTFELQ